MHCTVRSPASGSVSSTATRPRACPSHCHSALNATCSTFTGEWQCGMHCHSAPSVPRPHPFTATRLRAYRFGTLTPVWQSRPHCHSALNATCSTFTGEWQCRRVADCPDWLLQRIHVGRRIEARAHSRYVGRAVSPTRARCRPRGQSCILSPSGAHVLPLCTYLSSAAILWLWPRRSARDACGREERKVRRYEVP